MSKEKKSDIEHKRIIITDEKHGLPYSKGLTASSVTATGLTPARAYLVAEQIEDHLRGKGVYSITLKELRVLIYEFLEAQAGSEYAEKYLKWQALADLDIPLIVLIGGTTGVGKSTIAAEIAHRLGITRLVSTDAIRQVMRALFSAELMPSLYRSSFDAWRLLRAPMPEQADPVVIGFAEQTTAVTVGVRAIINRAIAEGTHMVLEGVHIVPGFLEEEYEHAIVVPLVIQVEDEQLHKSHFYVREMETDGFRAYERYRANFSYIRRVGAFIEAQARQHGVPLVNSQQLDNTVVQVVEAITSRVASPRKARSKKTKKSAVEVSG